MKPNRKNGQPVSQALTDIDLLCSSGYLAPRNEEDLERFDAIYANRTFETERHQVDADAIFNKVFAAQSKRKTIGTANVFTSPRSYLVASCFVSGAESFCAEELEHLSKKDKKE